MKHYASPDLIQDHPIAVFFAFLGIAIGEVLKVPTTIIWVGIGLFGLNVVTTYIFTYQRTNSINGELVQATFLRTYAYVAGGGVILLLSVVFPGVAKVAQEVVFRGVAGVEGVVTLGMLARMVPRFRPLYRGTMKKLDSVLPWNFGSDQVSAILDRYDSKGSDPS
jgi:hypothetical protein